MKFKNINNFLLIFLLFFIFSCQTISNYNKKKDVVIDNYKDQKYEETETLFLFNNFKDVNYLDNYTNNFSKEFNQNQILEKKFTINNYKSNYDGANPLKLFILNDHLYSVDSKNYFNKFNITNGKLIESINLNFQEKQKNLIPITIVKYKDNFIIGYKHKTILMINKYGEAIWEFNHDEILSTPLKIINNSLIVMFGDKLYSLNIDNGNINWSEEYSGSRILKLQGGIINNYANILYYILPNSSFGQYDILLGEKHISQINDINFKNSINYTNHKLHINTNFASYFDGKNKLSTYDIILDKIILKNFEIDNPSSFFFFNNSLIALNENKLNSINIRNGNLFWSIEIETKYTKNTKIVDVKNFDSNIYIFLSNGKVLVLNSNKLLNILDIKLKNINLLYFQNDNIFASLDNGKTVLF